MKELQIITADGVKKLQCIKFDGHFESFKEIYNAIKNRMNLIIVRYKNFMNDKWANYDVLEFCDGRWTFTKNEIQDIYKAPSAEEAWRKCYGQIYIPFIVENVKERKISFDAIAFGQYLLIDRDDLTRLYKVDEIFIDRFAAEV